MSDKTNEPSQLPSAAVLGHATKIAIVEDRPIMMDYWIDSLKDGSNVIIGVRESGEKLLVKSADEYTSPVGKIYKSDDCFICLTENSIYIVSAKIKSKRIS
jgi:hypothetical protein